MLDTDVLSAAIIYFYYLYMTKMYNNNVFILPEDG
jgi:hypothetical protein